MILHTGSRTDIPAFFSEWFYNRIREGFVLVRNPYNESAVTRYELTPAVVDLLVFCTKNPAPMLPRLSEISAFGQLWFVTITPYGKGIEPGVPEKQTVIDAFKEISRLVGADAIIWRYDPILLFEKYTISQHLQSFERMCAALSGFTNTCVISFVERYSKVRRNFPDLAEVSRDDQRILCEGLSKIAARHGISITLCGKSLVPRHELAALGIDTTGCMTQSVMERALHAPLELPPHKPPRTECNCYLGFDIGAYNTCAHFCRYCYANYDRTTVLQNLRHHDPASPLLIGTLRPSDTIHQAEQHSFRTGQRRLF